jgi:hypothetical protein
VSLLIVALAAFLSLSSIWSFAQGDVALQFHGQGSATGSAPLAPFTAVTTMAGGGGCRSTQTTTLPFGAGSARGAVAITEPRGCATLHRLTFRPSVQFTNALPVTAGHVLDAQLDLLSMSGSTSMMSNVQFYLQQVGGGNPILTATHALIAAGAISTASTSAGTLAAGTTYGVGIRMILVHLATTGTVTVNALLFLYVFDGGVQRAVDQQILSFRFTY